MKRRTLLASGLATVLAPPCSLGQAPRETERIGWLTVQGPASIEPYRKAFREGMSGFGYEEGRNLIIEYRYGDDDIGRVPELAESLVRSPVSLIIAQGTSVPVVKRLSLPIPVLFVFSADPIAAGVASSLARPGGNMTGITHMAAEINGKRTPASTATARPARSRRTSARNSIPSRPICLTSRRAGRAQSCF